MIRITKVKFDGAKVRIEYENKRDDQKEWDEFSLQSADMPVPEFIEALSALRQDVVTICELAEADETKLKVRGVTVTHTNDILGACITALKALKTSDAPLVLNTPHLPETPYGEGATSPTLSTATVDRIHILTMAAERYIDGERAQGDLLAKAELHDTLAKLGDPGEDGQTTVSFGISGGEMHAIDPKAHKAEAKRLREAATR